METAILQDALKPATLLAEIRTAAEAAAKRVCWTNECVVSSGAICEPTADGYRCRRPIESTNGWWLTDRGGLLGPELVADLEISHREILLQAIKDLS